MKRLVIGIDPGVSGALVTVDQDLKLVECQLMPTIKVATANKKKLTKTREYNYEQLWLWWADMQRAYLMDNCNPCELLFLFEHVHAMPGQGVTSSFNFGRGVGILEALVYGSWTANDSHARVAVVPPHVWKAGFSLCGTDKKASIALAEHLSGVVGLADGEADAYLIGRYGQLFFPRFWYNSDPVAFNAKSRYNE